MEFNIKTQKIIDKYLSISKNICISYVIYDHGKTYIFESSKENKYYNVGSLSKTITALAMLKIKDDYKIDINKSIDNFIDLKKGYYPSILDCLTHLTRYHFYTPIEFVIKRLLRTGYTRKCLYHKITKENVIKAVERRRFLKPKTSRYCYSDLDTAVVGLVLERICKDKITNILKHFMKTELNMETADFQYLLNEDQIHQSSYLGKIVKPWEWNEDNPYIPSGAISCKIQDLLSFLKIIIESNKKYILEAQERCDDSVRNIKNIVPTKAFLSYKKASRIWNAGTAGTFRSSFIIDVKRKIGCAVLGNSLGIKEVNIHHITKMLFYDLKRKKLVL